MPTKVRLWVGTRKGGYVAESDRARRRWKISGPFHGGRDVFHIAPDPRAPGSALALANSGFLGPMLVRTRDGGKRWSEVGLPTVDPPREAPPPMFEGAPPRSPIENLWHAEPGPSSEPKSWFLGIDPASLYRSDDDGKTWTSVAGINHHPTREKWNPGAGGMCLHSILLDPVNPKRMYIGISAAGTFRSEDGGESWTATNRGVVVDFLPEKRPEVGQCVHKITLDPANPSVCYRQDHSGIFVSRDRMESWQRVGRPLAYDFGFVVASPPAAPGTAFFMPLEGTSRTTRGGQFQVYRWREKDRSWRTMVPKRLFPGDFGARREGMAADPLDPWGLYVGTTTGDVIYTPDAGKSWSELPYRFPCIESVSVSVEGSTAG